MKNWKDIIKEETAEERRKRIRREGEEALKAEMEKNKKEKIPKGKTPYQDYLERQLEYKQKKYEDQKQREIENIRRKRVEGPLQQAKQSLGSIKITPISDRDPSGTAASKLLGNVGSTAVGISGGLFHGIRALAAARKKPTSKQPDMRTKGKSGRPKKNQPDSPSPDENDGGGTPPRKRLPPSPKPKGLLSPEKTRKRLPSSPEPKGLLPPEKTRKRLPSSPEPKGLLPPANTTEGYSNWREELLIEIDVPKTKNKPIDVMKRGEKNTIILNPDNKKVYEASAAWQRKEGKNPTGGLNAKGIASYRKQNPGSKLSMAVTTPPSKLKPGSKSAKRRKSFCARMGGMPGPMKDEKGRPTRKALALRKWNC
jgi:hypothetical protein